MPGARLELARLLRAEDFKSPMSTIPSLGQYLFTFHRTEVWARIELAYSSFAENRLTTWPPDRYFGLTILLFFQQFVDTSACFLPKIDFNVQEGDSTDLEVFFHLISYINPFALQEVQR